MYCLVTWLFRVGMLRWQNSQFKNMDVNFLIASTKLAFFRVYSNLRRWVVIWFLHVNAVHLDTGGRVTWTHGLHTSSLTFFVVYSLNKSLFPMSNKSKINYYHQFPRRKHVLVTNMQRQKETWKTQALRKVANLVSRF